MYLKHLLPHQLRKAAERGDPLLVPAGCIETHGPHMAIGHDTIIVEEICDRVAKRVDAVISPPFDFGPTGYALGGPEDGGHLAGYNETSFLLATRPELVDQEQLDEQAPWYCRQEEDRNSWTANVAHGDTMVKAVVNAWVDLLQD